VGIEAVNDCGVVSFGEIEGFLCFEDVHQYLTGASYGAGSRDFGVTVGMEEGQVAQVDVVVA
jgi:hypothetical protein